VQADDVDKVNHRRKEQKTQPGLSEGVRHLGDYISMVVPLFLAYLHIVWRLGALDVTSYDSDFERTIVSRAHLESTVGNITELTYMYVRVGCELVLSVLHPDATLLL
jgi:hypothetical protein